MDLELHIGRMVHAHLKDIGKKEFRKAMELSIMPMVQHLYGWGNVKIANPMGREVCTAPMGFAPMQEGT
jgi:hypothetical protein